MKKEKIQEIDYEFIEKILKGISEMSWNVELIPEHHDEKQVWNMMYLYDYGYIVSSFQDDTIPVVYTATPQQPIIKDNLINRETRVKKDVSSQIRMAKFSFTRRLVRGYYFLFDEQNKLSKFQFYYPKIFERGLELLKFLKEKDSNKRNKMWKVLLKTGAEVAKFIAPLILKLIMP